VSCSYASSFVHFLAKHKVSVAIVALLLATYFVVREMDGTHQQQIATFEFYVTLALWWIGLGVLSSVGLGMMQPHPAAITCIDC
jgi:hypothetical protein